MVRQRRRTGSGESGKTVRFGFIGLSPGYFGVRRVGLSSLWGGFAYIRGIVRSGSGVTVQGHVDAECPFLSLLSTRHASFRSSINISSSSQIHIANAIAVLYPSPERSDVLASIVTLDRTMLRACLPSRVPHLPPQHQPTFFSETASCCLE